MCEKKKIMFILTKLGGNGWGGAHKVSVMLANYLANNGYDVSISVSEHGRMDYPVEDSIRVFYLNDLYKHSSKRIINLLRKQSVFRKVCKQNGIDLVVGFTSNMAIYAIVASIFSCRKSLISERTDPHIEPRNKILRGARNFCFCFADRVVCQTPGARDYFPYVVRKKSVVIPNPISNSLPSTYRGERDNRIVNFCRIAPQKNLAVLFHAFDMFAANHPQYALEIYGDAKENEPYIHSLRNLINSLDCHDKIRLYPACPDVHSKVCKARIFASSSDYEGISNSMLEAMAIGLSVVVTDCQNGGERLCINHGENGMIVPCRDSIALANALAEIADNQEFADSLAENASKVRERFSEQKIFSTWKECVEGILYER